jgi:hypothetical protein
MKAGNSGRGLPARVVIALATTLVLASCSGGGGTSSPMPAATLSYPSPEVYTKGMAIALLTPTITGTLSGFAVSPRLPAGLTLNGSTGVISGTPTAVAAAASYVVSAVGSDGTAPNASLSITVNDIAPSSVSYGTAAITYTSGVVARTLTPNTQGGAVVGWSIRPALPAGLTFSTTDGSISGTPTAAAAATGYAITAQNSGGQSTVNLTIEVDAGVLLELGHSQNIGLVRFSGSRVLSVDGIGHWVLWDYASAAIIANGDTDCTPNLLNCGLSRVADVAGPTAVIRIGTGFEVHSTADGHLLSTIAASISWWLLATDGSYVSAGSQAGLFAWSASGQLLFSRPGDYSNAISFAAPGQIRVAAGPAGPSVVQTLSVPSGTASTSSAFNGTFSSWFVDGGNFLATVGTTVLAYSLTAVQQAVLPLPSGAAATGQGNWVWTYPNPGASLNVYAVGTGSTPAASFAIGPDAVPVASATTIGVMQSGRALSVIDLAGATPVKVDYALPIAIYANPGDPTTAPYAAVSAAQWVAGNQAGVLLDGAGLPGTPRYLAFGQAWSIAGSTGHIAIATASGSILYFNADTLAQEGTVPYSSSKVLLSSDGSMMTAAGDMIDRQYGGDWSVKIYSLPSGTALYTWPYAASGVVFPQDIALSRSGTVLGQVLFTPSFYTQQASATTGGSLTFSTTFNSSSVQGAVGMGPPLRLSPDGTLIAQSTTADPHGFVPPGLPGIGTNIFLNGALVTAVSGWPVAWIDNNHLVVNTYTEDSRRLVGEYAGCNIYDASGHGAGSCQLPEMERFDVSAVDSVYSPDLNAIVSVSTGAVTWTSGNAQALTAVGALAGTHVVFASGARVLAQSY